jgi:hypothetical protein
MAPRTLEVTFWLFGNSAIDSVWVFRGEEQLGRPGNKFDTWLLLHEVEHRMINFNGL